MSITGRLRSFFTPNLPEHKQDGERVNEKGFYKVNVRLLLQGECQVAVIKAGWSVFVFKREGSL